jgi:hypothetical protein
MLLCGILLLTPGANFPPTTAVVGTGGKFATSYMNDISGQ